MCRLPPCPALITTALITETARILEHDLRTRFGIARPRLAVAGLNPHAGEGGTIGTEDADVIRPAVEGLRLEGMDIEGPIPADTLFHLPRWRSYDAVIAMYHDQGLIPIKTVAFDQAVNVTLGPADRPHLARPRHGARSCRHRQGFDRELPRRAAARRPPDGPARLSPIDDLPPLREVIARHGLAREEGARPELPARPQSHLAHRARGRSARGRHGHRGRPRPRRPDPRAARRGRAEGDRHRARCPRPARARRDRRRPIPAGCRSSRATRSRSTTQRSPTARPGSSPTCPTTSRRRCWSAG